MIVVHRDEKFLSKIQGLEKYVLEELNVRKVTLCNNKSQFNVCLKAQPNHQILGAKFKAKFKDIANTIKVSKNYLIINQIKFYKLKV